MPYLGLHRIASTGDKNLDFSERFSTFFSREWTRSLMRLNLKKWPAVDMCDRFFVCPQLYKFAFPFFASPRICSCQRSPCFSVKNRIDEEAKLLLLWRGRRRYQNNWSLLFFFGRPMSASNKRKMVEKTGPRKWRPHFLISCLSFPLILPSPLLRPIPISKVGS